MDQLKIVLLFGYSHTGKTYFSQRAKKLRQWQAIHCIAHVKRYYERYYGVPEGSLDTEEGKAYIPPGADKSLGEILINLYHFWEENDPLYSTRGLGKALINPLKERQSFTINGIRNKAEYKLVEDITKSIEDVSLMSVWIESSFNEKRSSDEYQYEMYLNSRVDYKVTITNNYSPDCFDDLILSL